MSISDKEIFAITKSIKEEAKKAHAALASKQKNLQQLTRGNEAFKKRVIADTKLMDKLIEDATDRALKHSDKIKNKKISLPKGVGFEDFCRNGYIGSIVQTIGEISVAVNAIRANANTIKDVYQVYTTDPKFLDFTNRLSQVPSRGDEPTIEDGTIKYFSATAEIKYDADAPDDTTYRFKYRYKKNAGGYSNFETSQEITKESGIGSLINLVPGSDYEVYTQVGKGGIYGDMSQTPAVFRTKPLDPPKNFRVKNAGFVDMTMQWDAIEVPTGIEFKVVYKVTVRKAGEADRDFFTDNAEANSIKIDKLIPGFEYELCIATGANDKTQPFGQPSDFIVERTKPIDPPTEMKAEPYCDGVLLTWEDKRKEISSDEVSVYYNVQVRLYDESNPQDDEEDPSFMEICKVFCPHYVCSGLEKGVKYEFRVRSGVESDGVDPIPGKYVSDRSGTATVAVGESDVHTWCCCVCGERLCGEKKKALPKKAKVGFIWYCGRVNIILYL